MKDPIEYSPRRETYTHSYGGRNSQGFKTKVECGKDYVKMLLQKEPNKKPLFEGKSWAEIFRMVGINL